MDIHSKAKEAVLQELMDMMDSRMTDSLKGKSPKFGMAKVSIDSTDPKLADELKDKLTGDDEASEDPAEKLKEALMADHGPMDDSKDPNEDDEDLERLKELYAQLK